MQSRKLTNVLLVMMCFLQLLILLNQYDLTLVTKAEASKRLSSSELIPVAIHGKSAGGRWYPIETTAGDILKVDVQNWPNR